MACTKIHIHTEDIAPKEIWLARLSLIEEISGWEEPEDDSIVAYTESWEQIKEAIERIAADTATAISISEVPAQNWNAVWESNFEPVIIPDFVCVRAHFHPEIPGIPYDIRITPKMSFGTGHHATTRLMMMLMRDIDFKGKTVFDYGTGTGILAILAEMLGAEHCFAIDIDEWAYENAKENIYTNNCQHIEVAQGDIQSVSAQPYDIILANINRHILLESMQRMHELLVPRGQLLLSGILYLQDTRIILDKAKSCGFQMLRQEEENGWTAILLTKV